MDKLNCPHCGKPGISVLRRMCLGPALPARCQACGKKVGVPYSSMLAIIPLVAAIVAAAFVEPFVFKLALWVGGIMAMQLIFLRFPMEPR